ncbi:hypothetical protein BDD21_5160 [Thiocapsa rosea]|uniref:Uncharacterized protein n=1 Tax=Thiocapsa rosea TaxID=69360 RepID=A0A495VE82_9GAMM|nr:hypothetical protein BDD21_5160 [Thiocapsa rosea]
MAPTGPMPMRRLSLSSLFGSGFGFWLGETGDSLDSAGSGTEPSRSSGRKNALRTLSVTLRTPVYDPDLPVTQATRAPAVVRLADGRLGSFGPTGKK